MFPACGQIKTAKVKQNDFRICLKNKGQESQTDGPVSVWSQDRIFVFSSYVSGLRPDKNR
jgi:hypothetical protein